MDDNQKLNDKILDKVNGGGDYAIDKGASWINNFDKIPQCPNKIHENTGRNGIYISVGLMHTGDGEVETKEAGMKSGEIWKCPGCGHEYVLAARGDGFSFWYALKGNGED